MSGGEIQQVLLPCQGEGIAVKLVEIGCALPSRPAAGHAPRVGVGEIVHHQQFRSFLVRDEVN